MTYTQWFEMHESKHHHLTQRLIKEGLNQDEIIAYYRFENMVEKEKAFCELYQTKTKCHEMEELNCYLCACPNFRFTEEPQKKRGNVFTPTALLILRTALFLNMRTISIKTVQVAWSLITKTILRNISILHGTR